MERAPRPRACDRFGRLSAVNLIEDLMERSPASRLGIVAD